VLELAPHALPLVAAHQGHKARIVAGLQGVKDGPRQFSVLVQRVQEGGQIRQAHRRSDAVISGVRSQQAVHAGIVVALGGKVHLHRPAPLGIAPAKEQEQGRFILPQFLLRHTLSRQALFQDPVQLCLPSRAEADIVQPVVGQRAAVGVKEVQPLLQGVQKALPAADLHSRGGGEPLYVFGEVLLLQVHRPVRSECREDLCLQRRVVGEPLMPFQRVRRVVGGTDQGHVGLFQDVPHVHPFPDGRLTVVPDLFGVGSGEVPVIAEISLELQMAPVIEGIARRPL